MRPDWPTAAAALGSTIVPASCRVWSVGDSVSRIDSDISSSWVSFCLPKATAPLVTIIHSRPSTWYSATCSTIEASRPRARPCSSSRVMTALPSFTTKRRAYFSSLRS
uniref:Putative secreted protein n=1 Tax=Anopheles marajoara TaxID=58244 RepID=A0A2M4C847_9DIPT